MRHNAHKYALIAQGTYRIKQIQTFSKAGAQREVRLFPNIWKQQ